MNILLWDTRQLDVSKDFAGGFGVGMYRGHWAGRGMPSSAGSTAATAGRRPCCLPIWRQSSPDWGIACSTSSIGRREGPISTSSTRR